MNLNESEKKEKEIAKDGVIKCYEQYDQLEGSFPSKPLPCLKEHNACFRFTRALGLSVKHDS